MPNETQIQKGELFQKLHAGPDLLLMPNAWNPGSARMLAAAWRATYGLIRRAAQEMRESGTFGYAGQQIPDAELSKFFAAWGEG